MQSWNTDSISGSSPDVGSSSSSSSASDDSAAISATFCRFPLEYVRLFLRRVECEPLDEVVATLRCRPHRGAERAGRLSHHPRGWARGSRRRVRRRAADAASTASPHGSPPSRVTVPLSARSSPSRIRIVTVLPDRSDRGTRGPRLADLEVEAVERPGRAERLHEALDRDRWRGWPRHSSPPSSPFCHPVSKGRTRCVRGRASLVTIHRSGVGP